MTELPRSKYCPCEDWDENIKKINGAIQMDQIHGREYTGKKIIFCPWCGEKLQSNE